MVELPSLIPLAPKPQTGLLELNVQDRGPVLMPGLTVILLDGLTVTTVAPTPELSCSTAQKGLDMPRGTTPPVPLCNAMVPGTGEAWTVMVTVGWFVKSPAVTPTAVALTVTVVGVVGSVT